MKLGIDAAQANKTNRSGVEWTSWHIINALKSALQHEEVFLYSRETLQEDVLPLPSTWRSQVVKWPQVPFWTQIRLSLQLIADKPDVFFTPGYTLPILHPKKSIAMVHDLGFMHVPEYYTPWQRMFYPFIVRYTLSVASHIITPTEFTKQDIVNTYNYPEEKITVVPLGINLGFETEDVRFESKEPFMLYLGRLTIKKNIEGVVHAYKILREKGVTHNLVLAGKPDVGWEHVEKYITEHNLTEHITITGYISEQEKWSLLKNASVFVFPSFFEGFGIPVIEAMAAGTPVVTSNTTCLPEVAGDAALLVDPTDVSAIAESTYRVLSDDALSNDLIKKGLVQAQKYNWNSAGESIYNVLSS